MSERTLNEGGLGGDAVPLRTLNEGGLGGDAVPLRTLVLGSSPNAWCAALTLAEAGRSVQLIECAEHLGAPFVTLDGAEAGLSEVYCDPELQRRWQLQLPLLRHSGRSLVLGEQHVLRVTRQGLQGSLVSAQDARRWPEFVALLDQGAALLRELLSHPTSPLSKDPGETLLLEDLGERWRALGRRQSMEVLRLPWMSLRDLLDEWFQDEGLRGVLAEAALEGVAQGPFGCGTVFQLLARWSRGEVLEPTTPVGGASRWIAELRQAAERKGVQVIHRPGSGPRLDWREGRPVALELDGQRFDFESLLIDKDVRWVFGQLVAPRQLETEFHSAVRRVRGRGLWQRGWTRAEWPACWPAEARTDRIHVHSGLRALERCWDQLKRGGAGQRPPLTLSWPGLLDESRPADLVQAAWGYGGAEAEQRWSWISEQKWSLRGPAEFARDWQCPEGHLWGGQVELAQSFFLRPIPAYQSELDGLELCGVSLHPGDFSGNAGAWAARKLLQAGPVQV